MTDDYDKLVEQAREHARFLRREGVHAWLGRVSTVDVLARLADAVEQLQREVDVAVSGSYAAIDERDEARHNNDDLKVENRIYRTEVEFQATRAEQAEVRVAELEQQVEQLQLDRDSYQAQAELRSRLLSSRNKASARVAELESENEQLRHERDGHRQNRVKNLEMAEEAIRQRDKAHVRIDELVEAVRTHRDHDFADGNTIAGMVDEIREVNGRLWAVIDE